MDKKKLDVFLKEIKEKKEETFYKIFVEIGPGGLALPIQGKFFDDHEVYIGIDSNKTDLEISQDLSLKLRENKERKNIFKNKNIFFIIGDANNLPFEENFVDEMFFGNIFGDNRLLLEAKENFLKEASRVMKKDSTLIVKENISPFDYSLLKKLAEKFGFQEIKKISYNDENFLKEIRKYECEHLKSVKDSYVAYFVLKNKK